MFVDEIGSQTPARFFLATGEMRGLNYDNFATITLACPELSTIVQVFTNDAISDESAVAIAHDYGRFGRHRQLQIG